MLAIEGSFCISIALSCSAGSMALSLHTLGTCSNFELLIVALIMLFGAISVVSVPANCSRYHNPIIDKVNVVQQPCAPTCFHVLQTTLLLLLPLGKPASNPRPTESLQSRVQRQRSGKFEPRLSRNRVPGTASVAPFGEGRLIVLNNNFDHRAYQSRDRPASHFFACNKNIVS